MPRTSSRLSAALLAVGLIAAACASDEQGTASTAPPPATTPSGLIALSDDLPITVEPVDSAERAATLQAALPLPLDEQDWPEPPNQVAVVAERFGGETRLDTEIAVSQAWLNDQFRKVETVVLVSGENWAEATVAGPVASAHGTFVMLAGRQAQQVDGIMGRLAQITSMGGDAVPKAKKVIVVSTEPPGGFPTVTDLLTDRIAADGIEVVFAVGEDLAQTSVAAAGQIEPWAPVDLPDDYAEGPSADGAETLPETLALLPDGGGSGAGASSLPLPTSLQVLPGKGRTAILASAAGFADSMAVAPFAYRHQLPVLLTQPGSLNAHIADYLTEAGVEHVILMGGAAALSAAVETAVAGLGLTVDRVGGADRYQTAALFAEYAAENSDNGCFAGPHYGLAGALAPFDAVAAAPLLAARCAPLLFTHPEQLPEATRRLVASGRSAAYGDGHGAVTLAVIGGPDSVPEEIVEQLAAAPPSADYRYRSTDSALPAVDWYFNDHDEIEASDVFRHCVTDDVKHPDAAKDFADAQANIDFYADFDSEVRSTQYAGPSYLFATGWWTDDKLQAVYGSAHSNIDVEWAATNLDLSPEWDMPIFGLAAYFGAGGPPSGYFGNKNVDLRVGLDGWAAGQPILEYVNHSGFVAPRPADTSNSEVYPFSGGRLLRGLTAWLTQFPPKLEEPGAWGYITLQRTTDRYIADTCIAETVAERCDDPFTADTPAHLRNDKHSSPFGRLLWNVICGQAPLVENWEPPAPVRTTGTLTATIDGGQ